MRSVCVYRMKEEKTIFKPLAGIESVFHFIESKMLFCFLNYCSWLFTFAFLSLSTPQNPLKASTVNR